MNQELRKALYNISALADLGREITSGQSFLDQIQSVLYVITGTFLSGKGAILYEEKPGEQLIVLTQKGFDGLSSAGIDREELMAAEKNCPYPVKDDEALVGAGVAIAVPLWVGEKFIGAIILSDRFTSVPYTDDDFELLKAIATQTAVAINNHALFLDLAEQLNVNKKLYEEMRRIYHDTLQAFAAAIDAKDVYTRNHSHRVARYSVAIARELGWNEDDIEGIYVAGYLHDVGKLVISNELLHKIDPFTAEEAELVRRHPLHSHKIISHIKFPWKDVEKIIRSHHEKLDGSGYPDALKRDDISEGVKILSLADAFDAMTSKRAYREKMDLKAALDEMKNCIDTHFDNRIMLAFCRVLDKEIKGELPEPDILPHIDKDFDLSVISELLEGLIEELSA